MKHRVNKSQAQRIIAFIASPIEETERELKVLGVRLKKNGIAIDVISFGDHSNDAKLQVLVDSANKENNSHFLPVESGPGVVLTEVLARSDILGSSMLMGNSSGEDDIDLAIRLSLAESGGGTGAQPADMGSMDAADEDALMAQAISLSLAQEQGSTSNTDNKDNTAFNAPPEEEMEVDDDLELAIRLSMQDSVPEQTTTAPTTEQNKPASKSTTSTMDVTPSSSTTSESVSSEFLQSLVQDLPDVDPNDPNFKEILESLKGPQETPKKDDKKSEK